MEELHRVLKNGDQFNSLFPTVKCERVALGNGDTDYSINKMVQWIEQHQSQTTKVAALLEKSSLKNTCESIHDFLYWHFQYKQDLDDQLLRSPACAWKQRFEGIDCKSYSIVASSLLLNLGITHYLRKVAYTNPGEFTHVYVVVPVNQTNFKLDDGYYMIDGTIDTMEEPYYLESKDQIMLAHYGLNRPEQTQLNGIKFDVNSLKSLNLGTIKNLVSNLSCFGGSAYTGDLLNNNISKLTDTFNGIVSNINKAIAGNDLKSLSDNYADFYGWAHTFRYSQQAVKQGGWNSCSNKNFDAFDSAAAYFIGKVYPALDAYINKYFDKVQSGSHHYTNSGLESQGWTFMEMDYYTHNIDVYTYTLSIKQGVTQIPAFEFTQDLVNATNGDLNIEKYLNGLQTIINVVAPNNTGNGTTGTGSTTGTGNNSSNGTTTGNGSYTTGTGSTSTPVMAGFGWIVGLGLVGWGLSIAMGKSKGMPSTSRTNSTKSRTTASKKPVSRAKKTTIKK